MRGIHSEELVHGREGLVIRRIFVFKSAKTMIVFPGALTTEELIIRGFFVIIFRGLF